MNTMTTGILRTITLAACLLLTLHAEADATSKRQDYAKLSAAELTDRVKALHARTSAWADTLRSALATEAISEQDVSGPLTRLEESQATISRLQQGLADVSRQFVAGELNATAFEHRIDLIEADMVIPAAEVFIVAVPSVLECDQKYNAATARELHEQWQQADEADRWMVSSRAQAHIQYRVFDCKRLLELIESDRALLESKLNTLALRIEDHHRTKADQIRQFVKSSLSYRDGIDHSGQSKIQRALSTHVVLIPAIGDHQPLRFLITEPPELPAVEIDPFIFEPGALDDVDFGWSPIDDITENRPADETPAIISFLTYHSDGDRRRDGHVTVGGQLEVFLDLFDHDEPVKQVKVKVMRDDATIESMTLTLKHLDADAVRRRSLSRLVDMRSPADPRFMYQSLKIRLKPEQGETMIVDATRDAPGTPGLTVAPGDSVVVIVSDVQKSIDIEEAQPRLRIVRKIGQEYEPVNEEALAFGVSYFLELRLPYRRGESSMDYEITWGDSEYTRKQVLMLAVSSTDPAQRRLELRHGHTLFRSSQPIVMETSTVH